jgi:hypothetical protein
VLQIDRKQKGAGSRKRSGSKGRAAIDNIKIRNDTGDVLPVKGMHKGEGELIKVSRRGFM